MTTPSIAANSDFMTNDETQLTIDLTIALWRDLNAAGRLDLRAQLGNMLRTAGSLAAQRQGIAAIRATLEGQAE